MRYVALLSGECTEMALCELQAYLSSRNATFRLLENNEQIVVFEANDGVDFSGLSLTHEVCIFFGYNVDDVDTGELGKRVKVRARKMPKHRLKPSEAEKTAGRRLKDAGIKIDFSSSVVLRVYVAEKCYFGKLISVTDRKALRARDAKSRPYLGAGTTNAIYARAFVNLAHGKKGMSIIDPFCGSGAFLIEAGMMGMEVHGCDVSKRHAEGCVKNLVHYGVVRHDVRVMDALLLSKSKKRFDCVVTDLPWGKSTVLGYEKDELYRKFMAILPKIVKKGGYAVVSSDVPELWYPADVRLVSRFELYVHRSAMRYVRVFRT